MVAWNMTMKTPECPDGRDIVVIANDMTHKIGSFGPQEDLLFKVSPTWCDDMYLDSPLFKLVWCIESE